MTFTIDVHHHILPDVFWRATNDAHNPVGGISPAPWSKESTLSYMDDAGIDVAITSTSTPGVHMGDDAAARDLARRVNEISAELIKQRPDRFGGFAALPLPDVDGALRTLEYGLDVIPGAEERGKAADTLRRLYWDTALSWHPANLRMLRSVVGMGQVLFGSDYPYLRRDLAVSCRREVESSAELQANEARAVLVGSALKLFPRFAGHAAPQTTNTA
jgi:predicted TIM-barrel fold metal-dependent hydrolase